MPQNVALEIKLIISAQTINQFLTDKLYFCLLTKALISPAGCI